MNTPCKKCGEKRIETKNGSRIRYRCRPCEATYQRENYANNVEKYGDHLRCGVARSGDLFGQA